MLTFLRDLLPEGELLLSSYNEAKKLLKKFGVRVDDLGAYTAKRYMHVRMIAFYFWKNKKDLQACSICHSSRWNESHSKGKKKKNIPYKVLRYFLITPWLRRLFMSRHTASDMRWYKEENKSTMMSWDIHRMEMHGNIHPWFAADLQNVMLGLATDGFNPYSHLSTTYSMWPIMMFPYNLPIRHMNYYRKLEKNEQVVRSLILKNASLSTQFWHHAYWKEYIWQHFYTIFNIEGRTEDIVKTCLDLEDMQIRKKLHWFDGS